MRTCTGPTLPVVPIVGPVKKVQNVGFQSTVYQFKTASKTDSVPLITTSTAVAGSTPEDSRPLPTKAIELLASQPNIDSTGHGETNKQPPPFITSGPKSFSRRPGAPRASDFAQTLAKPWESVVLVVGGRTFSVTVTQITEVHLPAGNIALQSGIEIIPTGQRLKSGFITTIDGLPISFDASASTLVVAGVTMGLSMGLSPTRTLPSVNSILLAADGMVPPNDQFLTSGSASINNGMIVPLDTSARFMVVSGVTVGFIPQPTLPPGYTLVQDGGGIILPNGETLRPGEATTVSGTLVSLDASSSVLVFGPTGTSASSLRVGETSGVSNPTASAGGCISYWRAKSIRKVAGLITLSLFLLELL